MASINDLVQAELDSALGAITPEASPKKAKKPDFKKTEAIKCGEGQVPFSEKFGFTPKGDVDHPVTCYKPEDWDEKMRTFIPKLRSDYVWQEDALEELVVGIEIGDNVWISGPTGSGKSTLIEQFCAATCRPFIRFNGREDTESGPIFGQLAAPEGVTEWFDGLLTEGVKYGAVVLMDEATVIPSGIAMGLQWLLEDEGKLMLTDKPGTAEDKIIVPENRFRLIFGDNTKGQGDATGRYAATNVFNTATLDRFGTFIDLDYLNAVHEKAILSKAFPDLQSHVADKMIQFAGLVRENNRQEEIALTISPRTLLSWAEKALYYKSIDKALRASFFNKLDSDEERQAVKGHFSTVFGREMD